MPEVLSQHPSHTALLLAVEGELPPRELEFVRQHLARCPICQDVIEQINGTVEEYQDHLRAFEREDEHASRWHAFRVRLLEGARSSWRLPVPHPSRGWLRAAAIVPIVILILLQHQFAPTLRADELLDRAARQESVATGQAWVRVRVTGPDGVAREISGPDQRQDVHLLLTRFQSAGVSWQQPLSARAFQSWRGALTQKHDRVIDDAEFISVETTTETGPVRLGRLMMDRAAGRTQRVQWRLDDATQIEIARIDPEPTLPTLPSLTAKAAPVASEQLVALDHVEVRLRETLHRLNADLTEDFVIARSADQRRLTVTGVVSDAARKSSIVEALSPLSGVAVRVRAAAEVPPPPMDSRPTDAVILQDHARQARLSDWLQRAFPRVQDQQAYGAQVLARAAAIRSRALALDRLVRRYPNESLTKLSQADRAIVSGIMDDHRRAIADTATQLQADLAPAFQDASIASPAIDSTSDSSRSVATLLEHSERLQQASFALFADVDAEPSDVRDPHELLEHVARDLATIRQWTASSTP